MSVAIPVRTNRLSAIGPIAPEYGTWRFSLYHQVGILAAQDRPEPISMAYTPLSSWIEHENRPGDFHPPPASLEGVPGGFRGAISGHVKTT